MPGRERSVIRTPDQRLRVFVSSTLQELAEERAAAREACTKLRFAPVMFELGARPHPPRDLYRAYLDQSHIFVGIYWQRYGWVAPGETIGVADLPETIRYGEETQAEGEGTSTLKEFKETSERAFLVSKLRENGWNISQTAQVIGTPRSNLYKKLEQYKISQERDG